MAEIDEIMKQVEEMEQALNGFMGAFTQTTFTLIAQMAEITDSLSRISEAAEMLPKLKSQNAENVKSLNKLETSFGFILQKLDKMAMEGMTLPTGPIPASTPAPEKKPAAPMSLDSPIDISLDSPAPVSLDSTVDSSLDSPVSQQEPSLSETVPKVEPEIIPETPKIDEPKPTEPIAPSQTKQADPKPVESINFELPSENRDNAASELNNMFKEMATLKPQVEDESPASTLPVLQVSDPTKPVQKVFLALSKSVNAAGSFKELGDLVTQAKDDIANLIRFHSALFDMIKVANGYFKRKADPLNEEEKKDVQAQVKDWYDAIVKF